MHSTSDILYFKRASLNGESHNLPKTKTSSQQESNARIPAKLLASKFPDKKFFTGTPPSASNLFSQGIFPTEAHVQLNQDELIELKALEDHSVKYKEQAINDKIAELNEIQERIKMAKENIKKAEEIYKQSLDTYRVFAENPTEYEFPMQDYINDMLFKKQDRERDLEILIRDQNKITQEIEKIKANFLAEQKLLPKERFDELKRKKQNREEFEQWWAQYKKFTENDDVERAIEEGRAVVRTFAKEEKEVKKIESGSAIGASGVIGLNHLGKMMNPDNVNSDIKIREGGLFGLSYVKLPSKIYKVNIYPSPEVRRGVITALPTEEDLKKFKDFTREKFNKQTNKYDSFAIDNEVHPELIRNVKSSFTRMPILSAEDCHTRVNVVDGKQKVRIRWELQPFEDEFKSQALNYQSNPLDEKEQKFVKVALNEAVIKPRNGSKHSVVAFSKEDYEELKSQKPWETLTNQGLSTSNLSIGWFNADAGKFNEREEVDQLLKNGGVSNINRRLG